MSDARRSLTIITLAVGAATLVAACGTQLPDKRFAAGNGATVTTETVAPGAATDAGGAAAPTDDGSGAAAPTDSGAAAPTDSGGAAAPTDGGGGSGPVVVAPGGGGTKTSAPGTSTQTTAPGGGGTKTSTAPGAKASPTAGKTSAAGGGGPNTASDVGVTATTITLGNIVSAGGIFGAEQFGSTYYGVSAYFNDLNAKGGINGRKVILKQYNDNGDGSQDSDKVNQAIDTDKVMAFVGNNVYQYSGAPTVSEKDIPDIGGQPIDNSYYRYPHLYNVLGYNGPQDKNNYGFNNFNYANPDYASFFKNSLGVKTIGIVYYDQASSKRGADVVGQGFATLGLKVNKYPVNLGLPNFSNTVAQMQSDGVDLVADAMDSNGNAKLCSSMEGNSAFISQVKAKVSTIANWSQRIPSEYKSTPKCRNLLYSTGSSAAYSLTANPEVAAFRAASQKYYGSRTAGLMSQWTFEGWLAAHLFTEAATSCGANLTRKCIEAYITKPGYVFNPSSSTTGFSWDLQPESNFKGKSKPNVCTSDVHWTDSPSPGTFTSVADPQHNCFSNLPYYAYVLS